MRTIDPKAEIEKMAKLTAQIKAVDAEIKAAQSKPDPSKA